MSLTKSHTASGGAFIVVVYSTSGIVQSSCYAFCAAASPPAIQPNVIPVPMVLPAPG